MATANDLPLEILGKILGNLGRVSCLSSARLACRLFDASFRENKAAVLRGIIKQLIPSDLLPYAIALALKEPTVPTAESLKAMISTLYDKPGDLIEQFTRIPIDKLYDMMATHDRIDWCVAEFSANALNIVFNPPVGATNDQGPLTLSATEKIRIGRAFYRVEWFLKYFGCYAQGPGSRIAFADGPAWFYGQHNPWECHQIRTAYDFLDGIIGEVCDRLTANSLMSKDGVDMFHRFSLGEGLQHILTIKSEFGSSVPKKVLEERLYDMMEESWLDPFAPRNNINLSAYSDRNDSLMGPDFASSHAEAGDRDPEMRCNWARAYRERKGIIDEDEMDFLRKMGYVFWDKRSDELSPISIILEYIAEQAPESDGSEISWDTDESEDEDSAEWS